MEGLKSLLTQREYRKDADIINEHGKLAADISKRKDELENLPQTKNPRCRKPKLKKIRKL